jgi:transcriptional regulator with GAF, ATPase, and Fis domain
LEEVEKEHIVEVLNKVNWKVSGEKGAAKILGYKSYNPRGKNEKIRDKPIARN